MTQPEGDLNSRDRAARMAFLAVALVFVAGLVIGFVLGRTL
jgi:hypothetical protein